ncbi:MAG TPA: hypothetical protein VHM72_10730 [Solirubrobacteraceae bacterium]|nr:hypothetical protein [Solirubrobacteraceae bacterium]
MTGASGTDLASATYRVDLFRRFGFTLWDFGWYAGHWTLGYSVLFPAVGAGLGIAATAVACAAASAWAFDCLVVPRYGRAGRFGSLTFAAGTVVQVAIGRGPFLLGQALGLAAVVALQRRGYRSGVLAVTLAVACSLASPLPGLFLALATFAWLVGELPAWRWSLAATVVGAAVPIGALELLFPGQGRMPFAVLDLFGTLVPLAVIALLLDRRERILRLGVALYGALTVASYLIPTALGVNVTRLATSVGLGFIICLPARSVRSRLLFGAAFVVLFLGQWMPARGPLLGWRNPATTAAYFRPLLDYLVPREHPLARVEVVPLSTHWESDFVALRLPLARGWERQLDTADNPIFYQPGRLTAKSYRAWLEHNGVRYVALADAPLDYAGIAEARLVRHGVAGLRLVWASAHWHVYELAGGGGIVSGPGVLVSERSARVVLDAARRGRLLVRVRYTPDWRVESGRASLRESAGGWLTVSARRSGRIVLQISL